MRHIQIEIAKDKWNASLLPPLTQSSARKIHLVPQQPPLNAQFVISLQSQKMPSEILHCRANRRLVSAVDARRSRTISLMRRGDIQMSRAMALCDCPDGFRKSSSKTSPDVEMGRRSDYPVLVGVDNFNIACLSITPFKTYAPSPRCLHGMSRHA
jgi:hypothetical protein